METESNRMKKSGNDTKIRTTGEYKKIEIIPRGDTIHGKIPTKTFGTDRPTEKIIIEK